MAVGERFTIQVLSLLLFIISAVFIPSSHQGETVQEMIDKAEHQLTAVGSKYKVLNQHYIGVYHALRIA